MNYQVEYRDQNWIAADMEAASPAEAAKLYLRQDSEMRWQDYDEIVVFWGLFGKQSESFLVQDILPLSGSMPPETVISGPLARLKHRLFAGNAPEIPGQPPKAIRWFKIYSGVQCFLYLAFSLFCFFAYPAETEIEEEGAHVAAALQLVVGLAFLGAWVLPNFVPPQPWLWTYNLVVIWLGIQNACMLPASIPMLKNWHKPETKILWQELSMNRRPPG